MTAASRSVRCSGTLRSLLLFFSLAFFFMAGPFVGVQAPRCSRVPTRTATFAFSSDQQRAGHCLSMYARGMTVREIRAHLEEMYGVDVSPDLISRATESVVEE